MSIATTMETVLLDENLNVQQRLTELADEESNWRPIEINSLNIGSNEYRNIKQSLQAQYANLSQAERLQWLKNLDFLFLPMMRDVNHALANFNYQLDGNPSILELTGPSGRGKTFCVRKLLSLNSTTYGRVNGMQPIVMVNMPPYAGDSMKPFMRQVLRKFGKKHTERDGKELLIKKLLLQLHTHNTELLIIDEVHHIQSPEKRQRFWDICQFLQKNGINCMWIATTSQSQTMMHPSRFHRHLRLSPYVNEQLLLLLASLDLLLPFPDDSDLFCCKSIADSVVFDSVKMIEQWTGGVLANIIRLFSLASNSAVKKNMRRLSISQLAETSGMFLN